jgi:hypothetical protein
MGFMSVGDGRAFGTLGGEHIVSMFLWFEIAYFRRTERSFADLI